MEHLPKPKIIASRTRLREVWRRSKDAIGRGSAPGADGISPRQFRTNLEKNIEDISRDIIAGSYGFSRLKAFPISKGNGKIRLICAPTVRDRLVQRLLVEYLIAGDKLGVKNNVSFGFVRDAGGVPAAIKAAKKARAEKPWAIKSDITAFFDRINRASLAAQLNKKLENCSVLPLLLSVIQCEVDDRPPMVPGWLRSTAIVSGEGLRQGMPLSPLLSNFILKEFDRKFERIGAALFRYADDFVIFGKSRQECENHFADAKAILGTLGHTLPEPGEGSKTAIVGPKEPIEFLGYEIVRRAGPGYDIRIPRHAFDNVKSSLAQYHDLAAAMSKYKTLGRLMQSIGSVSQSFASVYFLGNNVDDLRRFVEMRRVAAIGKIAEQLFGADVLSSLDETKRRFLGLAQTTLDGNWE